MNVAQQLVNGLIIGHAYALVAVGWTLLLGSARLVNFGHGQMYMVGAFVAWWLMRHTGLPYWTAVIGAVFAGAALGAAMQRLMLRLTIQQNLVSLMIATLGFGQALEGAAGFAFGPRPQQIASPLQAIDVRFSLLGSPVWFTAQDVALVAATAAVFLALRWVLARTVLGSSVRMVAEDPKLTQLGGLDVARVYMGIFAFEGAAVAFAACLVAPRTPILTSMGFEQVIMTFVVVVLGGIGSVGGSYAAGLGVGVFSAFFGALVSPAYTTAAVFAVLIAVMVLRPGELAAGGGSAR
ncbi:MAG: branched-chain amino acid ABC transporter permease [Acetobacteraceae bacterium]